MNKSIVLKLPEGAGSAKCHIRWLQADSLEGDWQQFWQIARQNGGTLQVQFRLPPQGVGKPAAWLSSHCLGCHGKVHVQPGSSANNKALHEGCGFDKMAIVLYGPGKAAAIFHPSGVEDGKSQDMLDIRIGLHVRLFEEDGASRVELVQPPTCLDGKDANQVQTAGSSPNPGQGIGDAPAAAAPSGISGPDGPITDENSATHMWDTNIEPLTAEYQIPTSPDCSRLQQLQVQPQEHAEHGAPPASGALTRQQLAQGKADVVATPLKNALSTSTGAPGTVRPPQYALASNLRIGLSRPSTPPKETALASPAPSAKHVALQQTAAAGRDKAQAAAARPADRPWNASAAPTAAVLMTSPSQLIPLPTQPGHTRAVLQQLDVNAVRTDAVKPTKAVPSHTSATSMPADADEGLCLHLPEALSAPAQHAAAPTTISTDEFSPVPVASSQEAEKSDNSTCHTAELPEPPVQPHGPKHHDAGTEQQHNIEAVCQAPPLASNTKPATALVDVLAPANKTHTPAAASSSAAAEERCTTDAPPAIQAVSTAASAGNTEIEAGVVRAAKRSRARAAQAGRDGRGQCVASQQEEEQEPVSKRPRRKAAEQANKDRRTALAMQEDAFLSSPEGPANPRSRSKTYAYKVPVAPSTAASQVPDSHVGPATAVSKRKQTVAGNHTMLAGTHGAAEPAAAPQAVKGPGTFSLLVGLDATAAAVAVLPPTSGMAAGHGQALIEQSPGSGSADNSQRVEANITKAAPSALVPAGSTSRVAYHSSDKNQTAAVSDAADQPADSSPVDNQAAGIGGAAAVSTRAAVTEQGDDESLPASQVQSDADHAAGRAPCLTASSAPAAKAPSEPGMAEEHPGGSSPATEICAGVQSQTTAAGGEDTATPEAQQLGMSAPGAAAPAPSPQPGGVTAVASNQGSTTIPAVGTAEHNAVQVSTSVTLRPHAPVGSTSQRLSTGPTRTGCAVAHTAHMPGGVAISSFTRSMVSDAAATDTSQAPARPEAAPGLQGTRDNTVQVHASMGLHPRLGARSTDQHPPTDTPRRRPAVTQEARMPGAVGNSGSTNMPQRQLCNVNMPAPQQQQQQRAGAQRSGRPPRLPRSPAPASKTQPIQPTPEELRIWLRVCSKDLVSTEPTEQPDLSLAVQRTVQRALQQGYRRGLAHGRFLTAREYDTVQYGTAWDEGYDASQKVNRKLSYRLRRGLRLLSRHRKRFRLARRA